MTSGRDLDATSSAPVRLSVCLSVKMTVYVSAVFVDPVCSYVGLDVSQTAS